VRGELVAQRGQEVDDAAGSGVRLGVLWGDDPVRGQVDVAPARLCQLADPQSSQHKRRDDRPTSDVPSVSWETDAQPDRVLEALPGLASTVEVSGRFSSLAVSLVPLLLDLPAEQEGHSLREGRT
jgi:hypothetical protein